MQLERLHHQVKLFAGLRVAGCLSPLWQHPYYNVTGTVSPDWLSPFWYSDLQVETAASAKVPPGRADSNPLAARTREEARPTPQEATQRRAPADPAVAPAVQETPLSHQVHLGATAHPLCGAYASPDAGSCRPDAPRAPVERQKKGIRDQPLYHDEAQPVAGSHTVAADQRQHDDTDR
jgi:hypothetical protein